MLEMQSGTGELHQREVAAHHHFLGLRRHAGEAEPGGRGPFVHAALADETEVLLVSQ